MRENAISLTWLLICMMGKVWLMWMALLLNLLCQFTYKKRKKKKSLSLLLRFSPYLHLFTALALTLAASASVPTGNSVFNILFSIIHFKLLHYLHTGEGHFQWGWRLKEQHEEVSSLLWPGTELKLSGLAWPAEPSHWSFPHLLSLYFTYQKTLYFKRKYITIKLKPKT